MSWATIPLSVEQGSQFVETWYFFTQAAFGSPSDYTAIDWTGSTFKMQVRESQDPTSTLIDTFSTATGEIVSVAGTISPGPAVPAFDNGFTLTIVAARSTAMTPGVYYYDLFQTSAGSVPTCLFNGPFEVVATVTR